MKAFLRFRLYRCVLTLFAFLLAGPAALAGGADIAPGFDLFETGPDAVLDLNPLIPDLEVQLEGVPLDQGLLGTTDTIVQRLDGGTIPVGGSLTVDVEMVALQLRSVDPVPLPFGTFNLFVVIDRDHQFPLPSDPDIPVSRGRMEIFGNSPDAGNFQDCWGNSTDDLGVCPDLGIPGGGIFASVFAVPPGLPFPGDVVIPLTNNDPILHQLFRVVLSCLPENCFWANTPPGPTPHNFLFPAGEFYAVDVQHEGPHPNVLPAQPPEIDTDGDGLPDSADNCILKANPDQRDTDGDNNGNACDADVALPNDCFVNFLDLGVYQGNFFQLGDLDTDNNGDNVTNFADLSVVQESFFGPPGPSGLPNACAPF